MKAIPLKRMMIYLSLLALTPLLLLGLHFFNECQTLHSAEQTLELVSQGWSLQEVRQGPNRAVRQFYRDADHFYIDKQLETLTFLEPEVESLQKILSNPLLGQTEVVTRRLDTLSGPPNAMQFIEGVVQSYGDFQETTESLAHPVEVNVDDLKKILSRIEGVELGSHRPGPNRPQLLITDFKLEKKEIRANNETFILNLKLLKREFL